jgi:hypothetical protein
MSLSELEHGGHAFGDKEVGERLWREARARRRRRRGCRRIGYRGRQRLGYVGILHPQDEATLEHPNLAFRLRQHDLAFQLPLVAGEVRLAPNVDPHHVAGNRALGRWRIRAWVADDRLRLWRDDVRGKAFDAPSLAERETLLVDVAEAPLGEALHRPFGRACVVWRAGHAWPVDVTHPVHVIHDLRSRQRLLLDARDGAEIDGGLRLQNGDAACQRDENGKARGHERSIPIAAAPRSSSSPRRAVCVCRTSSADRAVYE